MSNIKLSALCKQIRDGFFFFIRHNLSIYAKEVKNSFGNAWERDGRCKINERWEASNSNFIRLTSALAPWESCWRSGCYHKAELWLIVKVKKQRGPRIHERTRGKGRSLGPCRCCSGKLIWKVGIELGRAHILGDGKKDKPELVDRRLLNCTLEGNHLLVFSPQLKGKPPLQVAWIRNTLWNMCGLLLQIFSQYSGSSVHVCCRSEVDKAVWYYLF